YKDAILVPDVGVHVTIGNSAKEPFANSISSQFARLRSLLTTPPPTSPFPSVLSGTLPLVVTIHDPNDISKLLLLTASFRPTLRLVIAGATGAWAVADEIAAAGGSVSVLLQPARCQPMSWETRWCIPAGTGTGTAYEVLRAAGVVQLGVSVSEADAVRGLLWEAGWATVAGGTAGEEVVGVREAVGAVTWRVADMFGVGGEVGRIGVGRRASLVGLNGGFVGFGGGVMVVGEGGVVETLARQE
ncbi:hypothetical protein HDU98_004360, partial [Podochytrium sp. JEL0797]